MAKFTIISVLLSCALLCNALPEMGSYLRMGSVETDSSEFGLGGGKSTNCSCGWTNKARIVGGKETLPNEYPLIAGLKTKDFDKIFCGATILTPFHVITAAHCTYSVKGLQITVLVGEHKQSRASGDVQEIEVEKVIDHEDYYHPMFRNDISILLLKEEIKFNQKVGPACLPSKRLSLLNEEIKVIGWGRTGSYKDVSDVLLKVNLKVVPLESCVEYYPKKEIPTSNSKQICTHGNKKDSCEGDSGGPLIWLDPDTNRYTLVALVSYGKSLCATRAPAVNTDVSAYLDWIQEKIAKSKPGMRTCSKSA